MGLLCSLFMWHLKWVSLDNVVFIFVRGKLVIELKGYAVLVSFILILLVVFLRFGFGCGEPSTL